jgi:hypothetical protein
MTFRALPLTGHDRTDFISGVHQFAALVVITLHWVSPPTREILELLSTFHGLSSELLARKITKHSRHQVARILSRDGLPCLKRLRSWIRLIDWLFQWEAKSTSLYDSAISQDLNPAQCYRSVKRLTGLRWSEVRTRGLAWLLLNLQEHCHLPANTTSGVVYPTATLRQASASRRA